MAPTAKDSCTRSYSSTILEVHMGNLFFAIHRTRKQILHNCRNGVRNLGSSGGQYSSCLLLHAVDEFRNVSFITSVAIQPFSFKIPVSKYSWEVSVYNYRLSKYNVDQHGYAFPELVWQDFSRCATGPQDLSKWIKHARSWQNALLECLLLPLVAKWFSCLYSFHPSVHTYILYITLHIITLHYISLHYITVHYITLTYIRTYIHTWSYMHACMQT